MATRQRHVTALKQAEDRIIGLQQVIDHKVAHTKQLVDEAHKLQERLRVVEHQLKRLTQRPVQERVVVRQIEYRGDPGWIAETLKRGLRPGVTVFSEKGTITVRQLQDDTAQVWDQVMPYDTRNDG